MASSNTFMYASARSVTSGKFSPLVHGTLSLFTGRARAVPSQMPEKSGMLSGAAGDCAPGREARANATRSAAAHPRVAFIVFLSSFDRAARGHEIVHQRTTLCDGRAVRTLILDS